MLAAAAAWAEGREWAVACFAALSGAALVFAGVRVATDAANGPDAAPKGSALHAEFAAFQRSYLLVYVLVMLADWLQGTHMYTLYSSYATSNDSISVGALFFTGFLAAGVLGTFTGPLVDRYGRKRACLVYVVLEVAINVLEHLNSMQWLMVGRVLGGISTSLLFSAFEAWMVTEHRRRGFPEAWVGHTFGYAAVLNGATAIAAGFLAQLAADKLGDIGPFECAIALTVAAGVCILSWRENYAAVEHTPTAGAGDGVDGARAGAGGVNGAAANGVGGEGVAEPMEAQGIVGAWRAVHASHALLSIGTVYALFEGAMYIFVFNWVPSLARGLGGFAEFAKVQGLLFACLMAAISIGGELFSFASRGVSVERIGVGIFATAAACMAATAYCELATCGSTAFAVRFVSFLGFEVCVGAFQPCIATHRSKYVPDHIQSTVNNLFRLPLNLLVALGTMLSDWFPPAAIFAICAAAHLIATVAQARLVLRLRAPPAGKKLN